MSIHRRVGGNDIQHIDSVGGMEDDYYVRIDYRVGAIEIEILETIE